MFANVTRPILIQSNSTFKVVYEAASGSKRARHLILGCSCVWHMKEVEKKEQVLDSHFGAHVQRIKQQRSCWQRLPPIRGCSGTGSWADLTLAIDGDWRNQIKLLTLLMRFQMLKVRRGSIFVDRNSFYFDRIKHNLTNVGMILHMTTS